jgi:hypothetical protein
MKKILLHTLLWGTLLSTTNAQAQGFSALISPPRIETNIKAGKTSRHTVEITQVNAMPGQFRIYTNDWKLTDTGSVEFFENLQPGSCRPWVALEKRSATVQGNSKMRFRFEITPPPETPAAECTFAIMFEGLDTSRSAKEGPSFPISGRIAVIVYANTPGVKPELQVLRQYTSDNAEKLPTLEIKNTGTAHGRVTGLLTGNDAKGIKLEFTPSTLPIMPGETRAISLTATTEGGKPVSSIAYPISIKGALELSEQRLAFEHTFQTK